MPLDAEWVTGRLDVGPETAKTLVATARRLEALPSVENTVKDGLVSFDRTTALARIADPSEDGTIIDELSVFDVAGIRRLSSNRHRTSRGMEREAFEHRSMTAQPNLDESWWRVHGELPGMAGRSFVDALDAKADQLPADPDGKGSRGTRWADALWAISVDSLAGTDGVSVENATPLLTVFMDANDAVATDGEAGVVIESGPRVGRAAVEAILCDGVIEVTARTTDGTPVNMGRRSRTIPPRLRRFILHRDGGVCTTEGCISRYRLNLRSSTQYRVLGTEYRRRQAAVIHGRGFTINPSSPPQRRQLNRPPIHAPPLPRSEYAGDIHVHY